MVFLAINFTIVTELIVGILIIFTEIVVFLIGFFDKYIKLKTPNLLKQINTIKEQKHDKILEKKLEKLKSQIRNRTNKIFWSACYLFMLNASIFVFYGFLYVISNVKIPENFLGIILAAIIVLFIPLFLSGYNLGKNLKELRTIQYIMIESIDNEQGLENTNIDF